MSDYNIRKDLMINAISENKWWRLFNLRGLTVKLVKPLSEEYYSSFKGDRSMITIVSYLPDLGNKYYNDNHPGDVIDTHLYSDWVIFKNELTPVNQRYSINLKLLDFNYFTSQ
jgi:hypothetical protein